MKSMNERSYEIAQRMATDADLLNISGEKLTCGATVIDAGVKVSGSLEAGRLFSKACLGGLAKVDFCSLDFGHFTLPGVSITANNPVKACMAAQYAGWFVDVKAKGQKAYQAMGSGPARSLYGKEALLQELGIQEKADMAVLALESHKLPDNAVASWVAEKCSVSPEQVTFLVAPTASLAGSVQIAARAVETGLHKMFEVGFDISSIQSGFGVCPIAPIAQDNLHAIGRTNDAVLYGGQAWYTAKTDTDKIEDIFEKLPSSASKDYGTPFYELFQRNNFDFYKIDPLLFSPAEVYINELTSGRTFHAGRVNPEILQKSMLS
ncbi:methenyltetrahydromethanopterin cyclohydrolase [Desulfococcaceae bacterium HSG7]|nr:methenyltetrahydromethanopterin cyclohydrolase [Desulfococcaceae bacterium HSG7]